MTWINTKEMKQIKKRNKTTPEVALARIKIRIDDYYRHFQGTENVDIEEQKEDLLWNIDLYTFLSTLRGEKGKYIKEIRQLLYDYYRTKDLGIRGKGIKFDLDKEKNDLVYNIDNITIKANVRKMIVLERFREEQ